MQHYHFTIFVILLEHIFHSSDALISIKFRRVYEHYLKNRESFTGSRGDLGLEQRIRLCDDVLNARQFSTKYPRWHTKGVPIINLTKWDLPPGRPIEALNYQRTISARKGGENSTAVQYKYYIRVRGSTEMIHIKDGIQCARTAAINWFVTHGPEDGFMYLLENDGEKANSRLRLAAILEPGPALDNPGFEYFQSQHEQYRDEMESICFLGIDDHMRLCGVVLDTLDKHGRLTKTIGQNIHVKHRGRRCVLKNICMNGKVSPEYFLPCTFLFEDASESSSLFYTLADSNERGAVFVFLEGERGTLELHTRMVKVGALLYPVGPKKVELNAETKFKNGEGKHTGNDNLVSWREVEELRAHRERLRRRKQLAGTSKRPETTTNAIPSTDKSEMEHETNQNERSRRKRKEKRSMKPRDELVTKSEDELGHALQKSEDSTRGEQRNQGHNVKNKDSIEMRTSKKSKEKSEESECRRDGLERVSESSEEEDERAKNDKSMANRRDWKLLDLERIARTFADYTEEDCTNKSETSTPSTNLPQSWGRRTKRS